MSPIELTVNLDLPAKERWLFLEEYRNEITELLDCYLNDLRGNEIIFLGIGMYKTAFISQEYLDEIECIASFTPFSANEVLIANLYYDILKMYFGCSAFAHSTPNGIFHARNLDWHTQNNVLSKYSKIFSFTKGGKTIFKTAGWCGFVGALSGIRLDGFSVTLNAVLSHDKPELAYPISFLLRDVLSNCSSYSEAKLTLEQTTIASDCLLLLSGQNREEIAVIERTPTRFATRTSEKGYIAVTNDYKSLENNSEEQNVLQATSCGRYNRVLELLAQKRPSYLEECLRILQDDQIKMSITVQQMVFNNGTGDIKLIKT